MSLHKGIEAILSTLPKGYRYRITYDQAAKMGRWRIIAFDSLNRDVFGGAGASVDEARDMVNAEYERGNWWQYDHKCGSGVTEETTEVE